MLGDYSAIGARRHRRRRLRAQSTPTLRLAGHGPRRRLRASVIYGPSLFGLPIADPELKAACLRGVQRLGRASSTRTTATGCACCRCCRRTRPAAAVAELERVARLGHRGAIISPFEFRVQRSRVGPPLGRRGRDRAADQLPHRARHVAGEASRPGAGRWPRSPPSAPMQLDEPLAMMVFSGALERHPGMRLVLAESRHRLAAVLRRAHGPGAARSTCRNAHGLPAQGEAERDLPPPGLRDLRGGAARPELLPLLGPDNFMWASDYPHPDSTFPHSREAIARGVRAASMRRSSSR